MKRSFVRKGAVSFADPATRAGPRGLTLISTGTPDLDRLLGGGLPLGSLLLLLEDGASPHANTLVRCFVAQGVACGQRTLWALPSLPAGGAAQLLPALATGKSSREAGRSSQAKKENQEDEVQLRIAWQYKQYLRKPAVRNAGGAGEKDAPDGEWCHSFDLTKTMAPTLVDGSLLETHALSGPDALTTLISASHAFTAPPSAAPSNPRAAPSQVPSRENPVEVEANLVEAEAKESPNCAPVTRPQTPSAQGRSGSFASSPDHHAPDDSDRATGESSANTSRLDLREGCAVGPSAKGEPTAKFSRLDLREETAEGSATDALHLELRQGRGGGLDVDPTTITTVPAATVAKATQEPHHGTVLDQAAHVSGLVRDEVKTPVRDTGQAPRPIGRLAVSSLGTPAWKLGMSMEEASHQLLCTVFALKGAVRDSRSAAVVSIPAGTFPRSLALRLQHLCDAVVSLEPVSDDSPTVRLVPDPSSVVGILRILKLPCQQSLARLLPEVEMYVIHNRRRRIAIEPFQVDPDADVGDTERGPTGARPLSATLCSGPPKSDKNPLDF